MRRSNSSMILAAEIRSGKAGKGLSRWMPAISQWPVVVSLPGDASAHLPYARQGSRAGASPSSGRDVAESQARTDSADALRAARGDVAERVAARVAVVPRHPASRRCRRCRAQSRSTRRKRSSRLAPRSNRRRQLSTNFSGTNPFMRLETCPACRSQSCRDGRDSQQSCQGHPRSTPFLLPLLPSRNGFTTARILIRVDGEEHHVVFRRRTFSSPAHTTGAERGTGRTMWPRNPCTTTLPRSDPG